jgi:hypothetical protein
MPVVLGLATVLSIAGIFSSSGQLCNVIRFS